MGSQGTPQGSVLSPFIFNVAMIKLPSLLEAIPAIQHSLYADDITIWATGSSDGDLEERLQQAADAVYLYIPPRGLACSPQSRRSFSNNLPNRQELKSNGRPP